MILLQKIDFRSGIAPAPLAKTSDRLNAYSIQETLQAGHKGWIIRSLDITTRNETSFESRFKARRVAALP